MVGHGGERGMETNLLTLDLVFEDGEKSHGSCHPLNGKGEECFSSSARDLMRRATNLFDRIVDPRRKIKRIYLSVGNLVEVGEGGKMLRKTRLEQLKLGEQAREVDSDTSQKLEKAMIEIKKKYGANSISRAMSFEEGATGRKRNKMVGGHNA